jgi:SagB-type dehydrogenase family enzyme
MGRSRGKSVDHRAQVHKSPALAAPGSPKPADPGPQAWYVAEGERGQKLLDQGDIASARLVFEGILGRLGDAPSYGRAVVLSRIGRCFHLNGQPDRAMAVLQDALDTSGKITPSPGVKALTGTLRSELGDVLRAAGRPAEALSEYQAALKIAEELHDPRAQGVDQGQLAALALAEGRLDAALDHGRAALRLVQGLREPRLEAVAWHQLGRVLQEAAQWDEARRHYGEAARISEEGRDPIGALQSRTQLAAVEQRAGRLIEARLHASRALATAQSINPGALEAWRMYGALAAINERDADHTADPQRKALLQAQARDYRQIERYGPGFVAALARLAAGPSYGRAVILGRLGQCFLLGGRPDLAVVPLREARAVTEKLGPGPGVTALQGTLSGELGDALLALGRLGDARQAFEVSLRNAEELLDLRGQGLAAERLAGLAVAGGSAVEAEQWRRRSAEANELAARPGGSGLEVGAITIYDEVASEYAFDRDLLVDGVAERRMSRWAGEPASLADDLRPMLVPGTRTWMDGQGLIRFRLPPGDPLVERDPACIVMQRIRREVVISGHAGVVWRLIEQTDGAATVSQIMSALPPDEREIGRRLLAVLAATGLLDLSGRPISRFVHAATKKGVLPAGGLDNDEVLRLATDGEYRSHPGAPRVGIGQATPARLDAFHTLTRSRRSQRDYLGQAIGRDEFDALLHTACGVTGTMAWSGREVRLRAYPSSGALYAVEIYPVVLRVEGLQPAVYHYRPTENVLEQVRPDLDPASLVAAALPMEREMVGGAAAMICLVGSFARHERKYGQGGYRMMVAESGHISQNLVLAATALGLSARPFGGVFDDLLKCDLGLDGRDEEFLLAVLVGHAGGSEAGGGST